MTARATDRNWNDVYFTSQDGLRLHARYYPAAAGHRRPVLCLPGLARNARDFHVLASHLSDPRNPASRDVLAVDYRGRGLSAWDPNWRNYNIQIEMQDALDLLTIAGFSDVAVVGTSRGGLAAMMMACLRPGAVGAVVLNDIGPIIERDGLVRLIAYVSRVPLPATWDEATTHVRDMHHRAFPGVPEEHWTEIARQWFNEENGRPARGFDPELSKSSSLTDGPMPELWPQFRALSRIPTMAIRGEFSDVLSQETLSDMAIAHPRLETHVTRGQGHAPLLRDRATVLALEEFLVRSEAGVTATRVALRHG
jgi:pimeloyl-ACP methyl ester carboxylesterase